jgi:hypothetical protein
MIKDRERGSARGEGGRHSALHSRLSPFPTEPFGLSSGLPAREKKSIAIVRTTIAADRTKKGRNPKSSHLLSPTKIQAARLCEERCQSSAGLPKYEQRFYRTRKEASTPRIEIQGPSQYRGHEKKNIYLAAICGRGGGFCSSPA